MISGMGAGRADYGVSLQRSFTPPAADFAALPNYNKSLHPTIRPGTRVACRPVGEATRAPCRLAGELNRYVYFIVVRNCSELREVLYLSSYDVGARMNGSFSATSTCFARQFFQAITNRCTRRGRPVPRLAPRLLGKATRGPCRPAGELNRYPWVRAPRHPSKVDVARFSEFGDQCVVGPAHNLTSLTTSRQPNCPFFYGWIRPVQPSIIFPHAAYILFSSTAITGITF